MKRLRRAGVHNVERYLVEPCDKWMKRLGGSYDRVLFEEKETQVQAFLSRHPDFHVLPLALAWTLSGSPPCEGPFVALTPHLHGTDVFFAAVLERRQ